jgi:hypothetical protein
MYYSLRWMRSKNTPRMVADDNPMLRIGHGWDIHRLAPVMAPKIPRIYSSIYELISEPTCVGGGSLRATEISYATQG